MKKVFEKIGLFFSTSNEINENVVMGVIVLAYIMIALPLLKVDTGQLIAWQVFDASFFGIALGKSVNANKSLKL